MLTHLKRLYPVNDPYQPLSIMVLSDGEGMGWHFDPVERRSTSAGLRAERASRRVGRSSSCSNIRTDAAMPIMTPLRKPFDGRSGGRPSHSAAARHLWSSFRCRRFRSRHVTPVEGDRLRLMAVLTYDTVPRCA